MLALAFLHYLCVGSETISVVQSIPGIESLLLIGPC